MNAYEIEKEESLYLESLSDGEFKQRQIDLVGSIEGSRHAEQAWLLTNYDVWVANPHYQGKPVPHPESY